MNWLVYVAGPYNGPVEQREINIAKARRVGRWIVRAGYYSIIPHSNTSNFDDEGQDPEFWYEGTLELMRRCDAVVVVEGWIDSSGSCRELKEANKIGIPVIREYDPSNGKGIKEALDRAFRKGD